MISKGAQSLSFILRMEAPICDKGVIIRRMGRFCMEASPFKTDLKFCPARIPEISLVSFTVQGEMLADSSGMAIGTMNADSFIENAGDEINAYEKVNLKLYYANEDGTGLVEENRRNVVYNSNISLEKLVVEQLVKGPLMEGAYPTINPSTKIISVSVKDGICYVNLGSDFLSQPNSVSAEVTIYSITNSLVELSNVNKVQISIGGETNITYREKIDLNNLFERNLDLLVTP